MTAKNPPYGGFFCINILECGDRSQSGKDDPEQPQTETDSAAGDTGGGHAALEAFGLGDSAENNAKNTGDKGGKAKQRQRDDATHHASDRKALTGLRNRLHRNSVLNGSLIRSAVNRGGVLDRSG